MALFELGTFRVIVDHGTWSADDVIISYWNDSTNTIDVELNGGSISVGEITIQLPSNMWFTRTTTGYSFIESGNNNYFTNLGEFPYFLRNIDSDSNDGEEEGDGEVNDIKLSLNPPIPASGVGVADGSILASATGTNTPIEFALQPFTYGDGQTSGTFASLVPGKYVVYAKDSLKYKQSIRAEVPIDSAPETGTAFGVRWSVEEQDKDGTRYKVEVLERAYSGGTTVLTESGSPFQWNKRPNGDDIYNTTIIGLECSVSLLTDSADKFKDIAISDDEKYFIKRYKYNGASFDLQWRGYVTPQNYSESFGSLPFKTNISCYDRLGDLKNIPFAWGETFDYVLKDVNDSGGGCVKGVLTELNIIRICLDKLNIGNSYRIACNIFDAGHTQLNRTPLDQTYIDTEIFIRRSKVDGNDVINVQDCETVLSTILGEYGAFICSWAGYWYIIRWKEYLTSSVSYIEYDATGTQTTSGSFTSNLDFKRPDQVSWWRAQGKASLSYNPIFRAVDLTINTLSSGDGLLRKFTEENLKYNGSEIDGINGFVVKQGANDINSEIVLDGLESEGKYNWEISLLGQNVSQTYLLANDTIEYNNNDRFSINVDFSFNLINEFGGGSVFPVPLPPYLTLKYEFKVGSNYFKYGGVWESFRVINEYWVSSYGQKQSLKLNFPFNNDAGDSSAYALRIYAATVWEFHLSGSTEANMITALKAVTTVGIGPGARRIGRWQDTSNFNYQYYYYELKSLYATDDNPQIVRPTDYSALTGLVWELNETRAYDYVSTTPRTKTIFNGIDLKFLPSGNEPPSKILLNKMNNSKNKVNLKHSIGLFDLDTTINNSQKLFLNYTRDSSGNPTTLWTDDGLDKTLQSHLLDWISRLTKISRRRIDGSYSTDEQLTPIQVLKVPGKDNLILIPMNISGTDKSMNYQGELIEIGDDQTPTDGAFSNAFKNITEFQ